MGEDFNEWGEPLDKFLIPSDLEAKEYEQAVPDIFPDLALVPAEDFHEDVPDGFRETVLEVGIETAPEIVPELLPEGDA